MPAVCSVVTGRLGIDVADDRYAWVAGESGMVTTRRRQFMGYWRIGVAMRS